MDVQYALEDFENCATLDISVQPLKHPYGYEILLEKERVVLLLRTCVDTCWIGSFPILTGVPPPPSMSPPSLPPPPSLSQNACPSTHTLLTTFSQNGGLAVSHQY